MVYVFGVNYLTHLHLKNDVLVLILILSVSTYCIFFNLEDLYIGLNLLIKF